MKFISLFLMVIFLGSSVFATDRYFDDIHVTSPSGRFKVDAVSPDNKEGLFIPFQSRFTYTCVDTTTGKILWTRKQAMRDPEELRAAGISIPLPAEAPPLSIFVSDSCISIIRNTADDLIIVSSSGKDLGSVNLLSDAFTEDENENYIHHSTAGPWWTSLSAWYYLEVENREFFVVRPWWGRRVFVDVGKAVLVPSDEALNGAGAEKEKQLVLQALTKADDETSHGMSKRDAAYIAGVLKLKSAIPLLMKAEDSTYSGISSSHGLSDGEDTENEVDPHCYSTFTLRQVAQLSLRRLGVTPRPLPCNEFTVPQQGQSRTFVPRAHQTPRHLRVMDVQVGMSAKQVLNLIGAPDYVSYDTWSYDMDAEIPFSVNLTFDSRNVTQIKRHKPLWKSGDSRDQSIAY